MGANILGWITEAEQKQRILDHLLTTLRETEDLKDLQALEYRPGKEVVTAAFRNGQETDINIAGDSDIAMIYDVVVKLW